MHITEQFEIIQDYSNDIEEQNIKSELQNQHIQALESEIMKL